VLLKDISTRPSLLEFPPTSRRVPSTGATVGDAVVTVVGAAVEGGGDGGGGDGGGGGHIIGTWLASTVSPPTKVISDADAVLLKNTKLTCGATIDSHWHVLYACKTVVESVSLHTAKFAMCPMKG